nr:zinc finger protein ZAT4-like [Ipomoea batatas]
MNRIKGYIKSRAGSKDYDYRDFGVASNSGKHDSRRKSKDSSYDPEYKTGSYKKIKLGTKIKAKKAKGHECPFCQRVFKSGQALGGHKRSHFIDGAEENRHQRTQVIKAAIPGLLDLNVVPIETGNDVQFMW